MTISIVIRTSQCHLTSFHVLRFNTSQLEFEYCLVVSNNCDSHFAMSPRKLSCFFFFFFFFDSLLFHKFFTHTHYYFTNSSQMDIKTNSFVIGNLIRNNKFIYIYVKGDVDTWNMLTSPAEHVNIHIHPPYFLSITFNLLSIWYRTGIFLPLPPPKK